MFEFLFFGVLLGLAAGFSPGPLLALVVSETLQHNIRSGVRVALAPIITDAPIIVGIFLVLKSIEKFSPVLGVISLGGALFVFYLAFDTFLAGDYRPEVEKKPPRSLRKAVLVNALSPHPYLFWASVGGPLLLKAFGIHFSHGLAFLTGFYFFLVGSKVFLAVLTGKSRSFFQGKAYRLTLRSLAILLFVFGFFLFREGLGFFS
jgi:threonine/homoserine/homoserine lactone efflux protein